jgi:hypothetical protein
MTLLEVQIEQLAGAVGADIRSLQVQINLLHALLGKPYGDDVWNQAGQMNLLATQLTPRRHGLSEHGEPYQTWGNP